MLWSEVIASPYFKDLPFKIELNRYGKVEMTPTSNKRGRLKSLLASALERKIKTGTGILGCSIQTTEGVKVADVAWCSKAFIKQHGYETPYPSAPELCVEIVSPSNSTTEMADKVQLYLQAGAEEFWLVWENGIVEFYGKAAKLDASAYGIKVKL